MQDFAQKISGIFSAGNLIDLLIYGAIAVVCLTGFFKCTFICRSCARALRRAVHKLEMMTIKDVGHPVWQDPLFLGKRMHTAWKRFLVNAEQLDSRGMNCNVEDYINDDTVIYAHCHTQLGEVIPGILTSLGILGTFIGLVRGLGALDLSDAASTMAGISDMINGMNFAFGTSIAGCSCSLAFNILNHAAIGSAQKALDEFYEAFTEYVMQQPLSDNVQAICQQEDRAAFLRHAVTEIGDRVSSSMTTAVEKSLVPVAQSMNNFIAGQTQTQIDGLNQLVGAFISRMNGALGGQFTQLGQTLTAINQSQRMDYDTLNTSLQAASAIMDSMQDVGTLMHQIADRMAEYETDAASISGQQGDFAQKTQDLLNAMHAAVQEQTDYMMTLRSGHEQLQSSMQEYAQWSGRVLEAVHQQAEATGADSKQITAAMRDSSRELSQSYTSFVENISGGLSRTMGLFEENMHAMVSLLDGKLESIEKTAKAAQGAYADKTERLNAGTEGVISALSKLQRALGDMSACVQTAGDALTQQASKEA
jgi:hypothetical protein